MPFQPNSEVYFLNLPIEKDYEHQIYFSSKSEQDNYMFSKRVEGMYFPSLSYIKNNAGEVSNSIVRVDKNIDELYKCNYMMYRNTYYTDKWFYCFITKLEYKSQGCTYVHFETDVYQTWMFDVTFQASFVEREHVMDDSIGVHTINEQLECGEYVINKVDRDSKLETSPYIVIGSTVNVAENEEDVGGVYNGLYSGIKYYCYPVVGGEAVTTITKALQSLTDNGRADAVSSVFLAPTFLLPDANSSHVIEETYEPISYFYETTAPTTINNYNPKNKKLLCFPYRYLLVSNGNGATAEYYYEYFAQNIPYFNVIGALCPGCSIRIIPLNYKGNVAPEHEGLNAGKFPQCNWATDNYTNWLTINGVPMATNAVNQVAGVVGNAVTGNIGGAVMGGVSALTSIVDSVHQTSMADRVPPQARGNINCGDVVTSANMNTFHYYHMSIKSEYAKILDKFFDMFGYKINKVKIPNLNGRPKWNYVKTRACNIDGAIPQDDLVKFKEIFNKGVTLWKSSSVIGDYTQDNTLSE